MEGRLGSIGMSILISLSTTRIHMIFPQTIMAFLLPITRSRAELGIESLLDDFLELNSPVLKAILNTVQYLAANELQYLYAEHKHLEAYVAAHRANLGRKPPQLVLELFRLSKAATDFSRLEDQDVTRTKKLIAFLQSSLKDCYKSLKQELLGRGWSNDPVENRGKCFIGNVVWVALTEEQGCANLKGGMTSQSIVGPLFSKAYKMVVVRCPNKSDKVTGHRLTSKRGKGLEAFKEKDSRKRENHTRIYPACQAAPPRTKYDFHEPIAVSNMEERKGSMICHDFESVPLTTLMVESQEFVETPNLQSLVQQTNIPLTQDDIESNRNGVQDKLNRLAAEGIFPKPDATPLYGLEPKPKALSASSSPRAEASSTIQNTKTTGKQHLTNCSAPLPTFLEPETYSRIGKEWESLLAGVIGSIILGNGYLGTVDKSLFTNASFSDAACRPDSAAGESAVQELYGGSGGRLSNETHEALIDHAVKGQGAAPSLPPACDPDLIPFEEIEPYLRGPMSEPLSPEDSLAEFLYEEPEAHATTGPPKIDAGNEALAMTVCPDAVSIDPKTGQDNAGRKSICHSEEASENSDTINTAASSPAASLGASEQVETSIASATNAFAAFRNTLKPERGSLKRKSGEDIEIPGMPMKKPKTGASQHCGLTDNFKKHAIEGKPQDP